MRFVILLIVLFSEFLYAFSMNDVSILLPLPTFQQKQLLLAPLSGGDQGVLLPQAIYDQLPQLFPESSNENTYKTLLKVVAIRLDPCFSEGSFVTKCRRQIRMVWQPIFTDIPTTKDAAVHSFYEFSEESWREILKSWALLSSGNPTDKLQIHPKIKAEGLEGVYWTSLRELVLKYCGEKNLVRVTAMNVGFNEQVWIFTGLNVEPATGVATPIRIPRLKTVNQGVFMSPHDTSVFLGGAIRPPLPQHEKLEVLLQDSVQAKNTLDEDELKQLVKESYQLENPQKHNPGTVDCATCHIAQSVRQWGETNFKFWNWSQEFKNDKYIPSVTDMNLSNSTTFRSNQFRAFGYFNSDAAISQRVINETAAVLVYLSALE